MKEQQKKAIYIEEVLQKGLKIKFRTADSDVWYTTIVEHVEEGELTLALPDTLVAIKIILTDTLILKFCDEMYKYTFEGEISLIRIQFPQIIKVRVLGEISRVEKTEQQGREDIALLADVFVKDGGEALHSYVCGTGNTSLKLISKHYIEENEIDIYIVLPLRNIFDNTVELTGRIVNSKIAQDYGEYEVDIVRIDKHHRERLVQFLRTYQNGA